MSRERFALVGSKVMQGLAGVNQRSDWLGSTAAKFGQNNL